MNQFVDPRKIELRKAAREKASPVADLAVAEAAGLEPDAAEAYWRRLREIVDTHLPPPPTVVTARTPLPDAECRALEREPLAFGQYAGRSLGSVVETDKRYVMWLADQQFVDKLRRYLLNPTVRRQLGLLESPEADDDDDDSRR